MSPLHHCASVICVVATIAALVATVPARAQWEKVPLPAPYDREYYLDVYFLPSNTTYGWACSNEGSVIRSVDSGRTWSGVTLPWPGILGPRPAPFLESVIFITPLVGYVSGPGGIYKSADGGRTFSNITPIDMDVVTEKGWGCYFLNEQEGMYFVDGCSGIQKFFRTTNGGASWSRFIAQEPNSGLSDGIIYRNGVGFAVSSGLLWRTANYGVTWSVFAQTGAHFWTEEITNINATFLLPTAGSDCTGTFGATGSLRWTSNNGMTWSEFQTNNAMFGSYLIDETHGWGVGINRSVYYTSDAGLNWELRNCGIEGDPDDVFFIDKDHGWVSGQGLFRSIFDRLPGRIELDPPDSLIELCEGETIEISDIGGQRDHVWNDGVTTSSRIIDKTGKYVVTATDPVTCSKTKDSVTVIVYPAATPVILASKTEVCYGDSILLRATGNYVSWEWTDGSMNDRTTALKSGEYRVTTIDSNGCVRVSEPIAVTVRAPVEPVISHVRPLTFCLDDSVTLTAPDGFANYTWSSGETSKSIVVKTAGDYSVKVVDDFGCEGTSLSVTVVVLNLRNQIEVQMAPGSQDIVVEEHIVGQQRCASVTIRNRSDSTPLLLRNPHLLGNVFCSLPLSQLPITIGPLGELSLTICCSVLDTGIVYDTLELPDTCSSTFIPVRSRGLVHELDGISRCEVPVGTIIYKAGSPYRLSAPYPVPASDRIKMQVRTTNRNATVASAYVVNLLGQTVATADIFGYRDGSDEVTDIEAHVQGLHDGMYAITLILSDNSILKNLPFVKGNQ